MSAHCLSQRMLSAEHAVQPLECIEAQRLGLPISEQTKPPWTEWTPTECFVQCIFGLAHCCTNAQQQQCGTVDSGACSGRWQSHVVACCSVRRQIECTCAAPSYTAGVLQASRERVSGRSSQSVTHSCARYRGAARE